MKMKKLLVTMAATAVAAIGVCAMSASADMPAQWNYKYAEGLEPTIDHGIYVTSHVGVTPPSGSGSNFLYSKYPANPSFNTSEGNNKWMLGNTYAYSDTMQLEDGKEYRATFWYAVETGVIEDWNAVYIGDGDSCNCAVSAGDKNFGLAQTGVRKSAGGKEWIEAAYEFTYDASRTTDPRLVFAFKSTDWNGNAVNILVDDCSVVAKDDPTGTNLLPNGSFDDNSTSWTALDWDHKAYEGYNAAMVSGGNIPGAQGGEKTLAITHTPDGGPGMIGVYSNTFSLKKDKKYTLTFALDGTNCWQEQLNFRFAKKSSPQDGIRVAEVGVNSEGAYNMGRQDWNGYEFNYLGIVQAGWGAVGNGANIRFKGFSFTANADYDDIVLTIAKAAGYGNEITYVDNVCLTEEGSDVNLINDGSFEDNPGNDYWNIQYLDTSAECSMSIVDKGDGETGPYWPDGVKAVRVFYPNGGSGEMFLWSKPIEGLVDGKSYTLKFYYRGDTNPYVSARVGVAGVNDVVPLSPINSYPMIDGYVNSATLAGCAGGDSIAGMNSAILTFTYHKLSNENPRVYFRMRGPGYDPNNTLMYIDNFSLCETGTTKNLIKDGSFEGISGKLTAANLGISGANTDVDYIFDKGKVTVTADASNTTDTDKTVTVIAAYYYKNMLVAMEKAIDTVEAGVEDKQISVDININAIDADGNYKLRCFVWDSVDGMKPILASPAQFEAVSE